MFSSVYKVRHIICIWE
jgi:hypothetical protein